MANECVTNGRHGSLCGVAPHGWLNRSAPPPLLPARTVASETRPPFPPPRGEGGRSCLSPPLGFGEGVGRGVRDDNRVTATPPLRDDECGPGATPGCARTAP